MSLNFKTDADATVATVYLNFKHLQSNGDATSNYAVEFSKGLTTRKLVDIVLRHSPDEWGYVELKDPYKRSEILEYKCGKIVSIDNALFEKVADIEIATITASGGYSRMDYVVDLPAAIIDEAHADAETDDDQPPAGLGHRQIETRRTVDRGKNCLRNAKSVGAPTIAQKHYGCGIGRQR